MAQSQAFPTIAVDSQVREPETHNLGIEPRLGISSSGMGDLIPVLLFWENGLTRPLRGIMSSPQAKQEESLLEGCQGQKLWSSAYGDTSQVLNYTFPHTQHVHMYTHKDTVPHTDILPNPNPSPKPRPQILSSVNMMAETPTILA